MRVLEDTKMAGLCNRPQWYPLQATERSLSSLSFSLPLSLSLVAFYLTHDAIRRGSAFSLGELSRVRARVHVSSVLGGFLRPPPLVEQRAPFF